MLHITRDFLTLSSCYFPAVSIYLQSIFLHKVLGFSAVGNTGLDVANVGTHLKGAGLAGQLSASGGFTNRFTPDGYTVTVADINRVLAIRSTTNPMLTSGLWRIAGVDTVNNQFILGLRGEPPVAESNLTWGVYIAENTLSWNNGTNGLTGEYRGRTSGSSTVRIILQSPHETGWQVRLTYETATDQGLTVANKATIAPGFGGDSLGDFQVGGQHLHGALYHNTTAVERKGTVVGFNPIDTTGICRFYIWGNDSTGSVVIISRSYDGSNANNIAAYGLPEDEQYPDSAAILRLFAYGCVEHYGGGYGQINFRSSPVTHAVVSFGYSGQPVVGAVSTYGYLSGQNTYSATPRASSYASDNPFLAQTELQTVDLMAGMWNYFYSTSTRNLVVEPRRLGRFPIARLGRANLGDWTTSTDGDRSWLHAMYGVYLPWKGSILP